MNEKVNQLIIIVLGGGAYVLVDFLNLYYFIKVNKLYVHLELFIGLMGNKLQ